MAQNLTSKTVLLSDRQIQMISELMEEYGYVNISEAVRSAIASHHAKTFGQGYVRVQHKRLSLMDKMDKKTDKEEYKMKKTIREEATKELVEAEGKRICEALKGTIQKENNGRYSCTYKTYTKMAGGKMFEGENRVPFEELSEEHVVNQYK